MKSLYPLLLSIGCVATAWADVPVIAGFKVSTPPKIDGVFNEGSEWESVPSVNGLFDQNDGEKAADGATFWVCYDDRLIYVAARLLDSQPNQIRATEYATNVSVRGDDSFQVDLDLSGTATDFNVFQVNPKGATNILLAGGRALKRESAGEFQAESRITSTGWETELRIPWQVIQLPPSGKKDVRINFDRFVARLNRSIQVLPYSYVGYDHDAKQIINSGLDFKSSLTDQVQRVGPVNPDFRNVENQTLSLDFSHF